MGLDMNAYCIANEAFASDVEFIQGAGRKFCHEELMYWRKNNALHGWMEKLYIAKGGKEEFNCVPVRLTKEDILQLIADIKQGKLKPTSGFFFGSLEYNEQQVDEDLLFCEKALKFYEDEGNKGFSLYYSSWW